MGMKKNIEGWVGLGRDRQTVKTNAKAASLVFLFRYLQPLTVLEFKIPIMSPKDGNASVALLSSIHKIVFRAKILTWIG